MKKAKKTTESFLHYAVPDVKFNSIIRKFKNDGYAIFYILKESLCSTENHYIQIVNEDDLLDVAERCNVNEDTLNSFMDYVTLKLPNEYSNDLWHSYKVIYSPALSEQLTESVYSRRTEKPLTEQELKLKLSKENIIEDKGNETKLNKSEDNLSEDNLTELNGSEENLIELNGREDNITEHNITKHKESFSMQTSSEHNVDNMSTISMHEENPNNFYNNYSYVYKIEREEVRDIFNEYDVGDYIFSIEKDLYNIQDEEEKNRVQQIIFIDIPKELEHKNKYFNQVI